MKVEVAIIGAGPAGGMAALRLARTGLRVALLEKARLPRPKACGGAIPAAMRSFFDWDLTPLIEAEITAVRFLCNHALPVDQSRSANPLMMVQRSRFDAGLIERAVATGHGNLLVREGFPVARVDETAGGVTIRGESSETIQADFVIAADGAMSKTARALGLARSAPLGVALDAEIVVAPEVFEAERGRATFNLFCLPNGYAWIFPKAGVLSCGVGAWGGRPHLPGALDEFLRRSFPPGSIRSVVKLGHPIPLYAGRRPIATPRVCLVGDAASLVEPIWGEGIRFALQSGAFAADVVAALMLGRAAPGSRAEQPLNCLAYQQWVDQGIGREMDILYRLALPVFLQAPEFFYKKFIQQGWSYAGVSHALASQLKAFER